MPLVYIKLYTRRIIRSNPDMLFVFGDNMVRWGYAGQAKEARGEPNAVGIATKRSPHSHPDAFLTNEMLDEWWNVERETFARLREHIALGKFVVWPLDGIGSGLARLRDHARDIHVKIEIERERLERMTAPPRPAPSTRFSDSS